jgi:hypothetical protein
MTTGGARVLHLADPPGLESVELRVRHVRDQIEPLLVTLDGEPAARVQKWMDGIIADIRRGRL